MKEEMIENMLDTKTKMMMMFGFVVADDRLTDDFAAPITADDGEMNYRRRYRSM